MTRFARAKGSKASNEKVPEDSTPWSVIQEQLARAKQDREESKKRKEAEQKRIQNYETFLKERKVEKHKNSWFDFPTEENPSKKQKKLSHNDSQNPISIDQSKKKKNKHKLQTIQQQQPEYVANEEYIIPDKTNIDEISIKKKKKKEKPLKPSNEQANDVDIELDPIDPVPVLIPDKTEKSKKNKKAKNKLSNDTEEKPEVKSPNINKNQTKKKKKKRNTVDGDPERRKPINDRAFELIINGKKVELLRFDGFPVMKKDAERLEELKNSMIKKGIPKNEVQRTIKLERRRAEKALARLKREVCYNCRKGGHNLSDCPDLKSKIPGADAADGVCFKCGSTEHRQFECKVQKDQVFRFASCFICKEQGHIARQCPDNPKGLYPNGGACKLCGDVTHLRKDCPTAHDKREESNIRLETLDAIDSLEDVDEKKDTTNQGMASKKVKKIKF